MHDEGAHRDSGHERRTTRQEIVKVNEVVNPFSVIFCPGRGTEFTREKQQG